MIRTKDRISCTLVNEHKEFDDCILEIYRDSDGDKCICLHNKQFDNTDDSWEGDNDYIKDSYIDYPRKYIIGYFVNIDDELENIVKLTPYILSESNIVAPPKRTIVLPKELMGYKKGKYEILSSDTVKCLLELGAVYGEAWSPSLLQVGDTYFYLDHDGKVKSTKYTIHPATDFRVKSGNCFETKIGAEIHYQKVVEGGIEL